MYESIGTVTLKDGEQVEAGVVIGPDPAWADRVGDLLNHKGGVWRWQNARCLRDDLGIDVRFYLVHRDGAPFANMLTATRHGVGHFGHVYTRPEDRRKGALATLKLMKKEASARNKSGKKLSKLIAKQVESGGPTTSELETAWFDHYDTVDGYYSRMIDLRFELKDNVTREEWQQIFSPQESAEQ